MTLIKSHPSYKVKRAEYFFSHFNRGKKSFDEVFSIIKQVEKEIDDINQLSGLNIHCIEIISIILLRLGYECSNLKQDDIIAIVHMMQQQFLQIPPILFDENTIKTLHKIRESGSTISILSNTAFILGHTLDTVLTDLGIMKYLSFVTYSDQVGFSKPSQEIFKLATNKAFLICNCSRRDILHVGDNLIADIEGAKKSGIKSLQINSNHLTIKDVL